MPSRAIAVFTPDQAARLFAFVQSGGGAVEGPGLGLAIVRGVVELCGGQVMASSEGPGHGAVFTVRLPALLAVPRNLRVEAEQLRANGRQIRDGTPFTRQRRS